MKIKTITAAEYSKRMGWSPRAGYMHRKLSNYERTGKLNGCPGLVSVRKSDDGLWLIDVLVSWYEV